MKYQPYRDEPFQRSCEERYEPIKELASKYNRQFSVLDIGANYGWFGQQLVRDFDCVYVGIDNKVIDPHPRIWHIKNHFSGSDYYHLSKSEHFDIVLGLAVLHHIPDYQVAADALCRLGQWAFFEIPGESDTKATGADRHAGIARMFEGYEPIASFPSHVSNTERPWYLIETDPVLTDQSIDRDVRGAQKYATYTITSDFDKCRISIDRSAKFPDVPVEERDFIPGMNAHNFRLMGGKVDIPEMPDHPDQQPWNYIIGDMVKPIDIQHVKVGSYIRWKRKKQSNG